MNVVKGNIHHNYSSHQKNEGSNAYHAKQPYYNQREIHSRNYYDPRYSYFNGQCFTCHNFGDKVVDCVSYKIIITREAREQNNELTARKSSYNFFLPLQDEIECSLCNSFGHKETK